MKLLLVAHEKVSLKAIPAWLPEGRNRINVPALPSGDKCHINTPARGNYGRIKSG